MPTYSLNVEIEAASLDEALFRIGQLPTDFQPGDFAGWLRAYNLYGDGTTISYVNRLDVVVPQTEPVDPPAEPVVE